MKFIKKFMPIVFLNGFLLLRCCSCSEVYKPKIAIIGTGIGGASASHFLPQLFNGDLEIDMFESKTVGGRLATVKFGNKEFEAGGAIIHPRNALMNYFVNFLNLQARSPPSESSFAIWNGKEFIFKESTWEVLTLLKLIYRYGFQPIHLHKYVVRIIDDFEKIYDLQNDGIAFENVTALLGAMSERFINLLQISMVDHLTELGYTKKIIKELVDATIVVNYGQNSNVHAFVASVSIAGAGYNLWSIKGGNKQVPKLLISNNEYVSVIYSTVERIDRTSISDKIKYEIFYKENKNGEEYTTSKIYDIVIIAAPMTKDQESEITFTGFTNSPIKFVGEYQTTYATFVSGKINYSYFGNIKEFGGIISCDPKETKISSIGRLSSVDDEPDGDTEVWKIFSRQKLNNTIINQMFTNVNQIKEIKWKAYPKYNSSMRFDQFKLDNAMYHINAIEWAASAMEMSAIGGRNAAILAHRDYTQYLIDSSTKEEDQTHSTEL